MTGAPPDINVRPVAEGDFEGLCALYARVWQRSRDERYDRMRFQRTMDGLPAAAVAEVEGEVAGFFTLWPLDLTDGRSVVRGGEAMDVMTDERLRGRGIFPTLAARSAEFAAERGISVLFGAPNEAIFNGYLKKLSWASPGFIRSYVRPLSFQGAAPLGAAAGPILALGTSGSPAGFEVRRERPSDDELTACLAASEGGLRNGAGGGVWRIRRTPAWYEFRYQPAGRFDYRWIALYRGGDLAGFAIWALELKQGGRLRRANLNEVVGLDSRAQQAAIRVALHDAAQAGANFLHAVATFPGRAPLFRKLGFVPFKKTPLIARTLDAASHSGNPFLADGWDLLGGDFDFT